MRFSLIICLISGLLLLHAGATIHYLLGEASCISMIPIAEEEEETHYSKKVSKEDFLACTNYPFLKEASNQLSGEHAAAVNCNYEANRVDLPPELS